MRKIDMQMILKSGAAVVAILLGSVAAAQDGPSYTVFGTPGLIEMPTAESAERSEIAATFAYTGSGGYRSSFTYQLTPKLTGSFRYAVFDLFGRDVDDPQFETFDRSFDLQYRFNSETDYIPAFALGLRDFLGTGRYGSEYVVASKSFGPNLIVSGGIGWGRLGTNNSFSNPLGSISSYFEDRPVYEDRSEEGEGGNGGTISVKQFFRGDAALFGGVEYQLASNLGVKLEYSSNAYLEEPLTPAVDIKSPFNFGVTYRPRPNLEVNAGYLYGSDFSLGVTMMLNPEKRPVLSGLEGAPAPVKVRPQDALAAQTWDRAATPAIQGALAQLLAVEGIKLEGLEIGDSQARVRFTNDRYRSEAQAIGRVARMMTQVMPASVDTFVMEPMRRGAPLSATTIQRSDMEQLENTVGAADAILARATFDNAGPDDGLIAAASQDAKWQWGIGPYLSLILFDASGPVKADVGLQFDGRYQLTSNIVLSSSIRQSALGERAPGAFFDNPNDYVNVRTDAAYFGRSGGPNLTKLTLAYYGRLAPDVYSRVTLGYLEWMHAGVSAEVLWKPVGSRFALGAEVNHTAMRNRDMGLGFDDYDYQVTTGHLSGYYDIGKGYQAQLDVGRYLAGDWGATFGLDREFKNGWKIGGYFTLTDMPFDQFGEGSFDKGIRITIPYDYFVGSPSRKDVSTTLQSLSRDGGARILVDGRLYDNVRSGHVADMTDTWGRFWR
jgi:hypothetical protein